MDCTLTTIPYEKTGYFTKIVIDYLHESQQLQDFYCHPVSLKGVEEAVEARRSFPTNRVLLVEELRKQYAGLPVSPKQEKHLQALLNKNSFTITTAHQPNIFTGPLYFIYKILHTIKTADELTKQLPSYQFVPVFYMGSEDADLDELGHITIEGQQLKWETKQTGAVGRMKVDKALIKLIDTIHGQTGIHPYGNELTDLFRKCYTEGKLIQQATLELVNELFSEFGLLVVIPDNAALKREFNQTIKKELTEQFSHKAVEATIAELGKHYKVQAGGREINLFYLLDDKRVRIEIRDTGYGMLDARYEIRDLPAGRQDMGLTFSKEEILNELEKYPERFSANVILRGVFQETILPNIAFIGGGGELAYWLELKKVFEQAGVPYPILILRNSFLLMNKHQEEKIEKLGFTVSDIFKEERILLSELVQRESTNKVSLAEELEQAKAYYAQLKKLAGNIDQTLQKHTDALQAKALKQLQELEKKMLRAEKRKFEAQQRQISKIKNELFPTGSLQERTDNFSSYYARVGKDWLQLLYTSSKTLEQEFCIVQAD